MTTFYILRDRLELKISPYNYQLNPHVFSLKWLVGAGVCVVVSWLLSIISLDDDVMNPTMMLVINVKVY